MADIINKIETEGVTYTLRDIRVSTDNKWPDDGDEGNIKVIRGLNKLQTGNG